MRVLKSSSLALIIASNPDIPSWPASKAAYSAFSASVNVENFSLISCNSVFNGFILPSAVVIEIPKSSIAWPDSFVGFTNLVNNPLKAVPAWLPFIPALAIKPIATAVSSIEYPKEPATGATYLNVSPISATFVFAFDEAAARTSANLPDWSAAKPNAVILSVTISETEAKSSPEAAARFITPSIPLSISSVFQPAIAIYSKALPLSVAENADSIPICFALFVSCTISSAVAPLMALTVDIWLSKSEPTSTTALNPATATSSDFFNIAPTAMPLNIDEILFAAAPAAFPVSFIADWKPLLSPSMCIKTFPPSAIKFPLSLNLGTKKPR